MTNAQVLNIPIDMIDTAPQVRTHFNLESIAELAADIKAHGVLQPLVVQANGSRFMLLIGERRLKAIKFMGGTTAPAILATVSQELAGEVQLMENIQREDLNSKDLAAAIHALWKKHGTVTEVAKRCNKSPSWVSKRLALALQCGPATTALLDAGVKDVELLYQFKKLEKLNPQKAMQLVPAVIDGIIGREDINEWILSDGEPPAHQEKEPDPEPIQDNDQDEDDEQAGIEAADSLLRKEHAAMRRALQAIANHSEHINGNKLPPTKVKNNMQGLARAALDKLSSQ